ncbi:MAG TPA: hypothetical protein VN089_17735, partial [Duganella sp.]|nr:hypothetical protein [Duganella sp.]
FGAAPPARALDTYRGDFVFNNPDFRDRYALGVLTAALEASTEKYGPFELIISPLIMERDRLMQEMAKGDMVNLTAQVTTEEWERKLIPIRIPVDKGFSGYRIFLIDGRRQARFSAVGGLPQLRELALGSGRQWSSTPVLLQNGFKVVTGVSVNNLQAMLAAERFMFFPRSVEEAVYERDAYAPAFPPLAIEDELALYMPLARYFFVAPGELRLARRLEYGMRLLSADGRLDRLFHQAYDGLIEKVGLRKRRIFKLENPLLPPLTPLSNKAYWYDPVARP